MAAAELSRANRTRNSAEGPVPKAKSNKGEQPVCGPSPPWRGPLTTHRKAHEIDFSSPGYAVRRLVRPRPAESAAGNCLACSCFLTADVERRSPREEPAPDSCLSAFRNENSGVPMINEKARAVKGPTPGWAIRCSTRTVSLLPA